MSRPTPNPRHPTPDPIPGLAVLDRGRRTGDWGRVIG